MKVQYDNFIGVYDNAFSEDYCDRLIQHFEWCQRANRTYSRPEAERFKRDESVSLNPVGTHEINFMTPNIMEFMDEFNDRFWNTCYKDYMNRYSVLSDYDNHTIYAYKVQKTEPGGGYHVWHCEDGCKTFMGRTGVYILYLNDVDEGGETEFLYMSKRVPAKKGRLVIFPPNYPWAHRGNPPLSGTKYIMTGWTEFS